MRILLALLAVATLVRAGSELDDALAKLRAAGPKEREQAVQAVLALDPDGAVVLRTLAAGVHSGTLAAGWHVREAVGEDGVARPYQLYLPKSVAGQPKRVPLLVHMHGGVSRPDFTREEGNVGYGRMMWPDFAEEEGFVVLFPLGKQGCTWWEDTGVAHVRACIRDVKRIAPIDDRAVVGTGFSDGGSGCYYFAMVAPDPFAAFMPMNGHPAVGASISAKQLYLRNMMGVPQFAAMTQDDQLYPAHTVMPHLLPLMTADAPLRLVSYPDGGHQPSYFEDVGRAFVNYLMAAQRDDPVEIDWWCESPATGRRAWVEILATGPAEGETEALPDSNVMSTPGRVRIGINVDQAFAGPGVKVSGVAGNSAAASIGLEVGDVLVEMDGRALQGLDDLRKALAPKQFGDGFDLAWTRGGTRTTASGSFPPFESQPIYKRGKPTARISVRVEGQSIAVTTRNVRRFRLLLSPGMFGEEPVNLVVNGAEVPTKTRIVPLGEMLRAYAREADGPALHSREIVAELPAANR